MTRKINNDAGLREAFAAGANALVNRSATFYLHRITTYRVVNMMIVTTKAKHG